MTLRRSCLLLSACLFFAACSSTRETAPETPPAVEEVPGSRTVQGFRVQIYQTAEKPDADQHLASAIAWWSGQPNKKATPFTGELPVYVVFQQPYYRLRVGDFATRGEAERAVQVLGQRFPSAFVVPDTVTLPR